MLEELLVLAAIVVAQFAGRSSHYGVGRLARPAEIAARDIPVLPSGVGLPQGRGSVAEGKRLYSMLCVACHGENGEGRPHYPALVGGRGSLRSPRPVLTVGSYWPFATTIWD